MIASARARDRVRAGERPRESGDILVQHGHFSHQRVGFGGFWAAFGGAQRTEGASVALTAPIAKG